MESDTSLEKRSEAAPRRLRFSLRGVFLLVGLICLVTSNLIALRDLGRLRNENQELRDELGYLTIEDPERLHLINVRRLENLRWSWRIYVPQSERFVLQVQWNDGANGEETKNLLSPLSPGEQVLEVAVYRNPSGEWVVLGGHVLTPISEAVVADLQTHSFSEKIGRAGTFVPIPFSELILLEQYDPEATLFGGTTEGSGAHFRVTLLDTRSPRNLGTLQSLQK